MKITKQTVYKAEDKNGNVITVNVTELKDKIVKFLDDSEKSFRKYLNLNKR